MGSGTSSPKNLNEDNQHFRFDLDMDEKFQVFDTARSRRVELIVIDYRSGTI